MPNLDQPSAVQTPIDEDAVGAWLAEHLGLDGELAVRQFPSGFSNLTYLVTVDGRELVLRRPPPGVNIEGGHDMGREFHVLSALRGHVPVPEPLGYEASDAVLGAPFYVMERVTGVILRATTPEDERPDADAMAAVADAFVDTFTDLHALNLEQIGMDGFGRPEGYVQRQVEGWTKRYARAKTDNIPAVEQAFRWLDEHRPTASGAALIHNDYKYDNLILAPDDLGCIRALLDWEMATVGDPLMDLGSTLGYWVEPGDTSALRDLALSPTWWPGNPSRDDLVARYAHATGRDPGNAVFYYVYGLAKLAVIAQQIYQRWTEGHASDPRFGELIHVVRACGDTAVRAIERRRLSRLFD